MRIVPVLLAVITLTALGRERGAITFGSKESSHVETSRAAVA